MSVMAKKKFEEYKEKIHEKMIEKNFTPFDWDLASKGDAVYYKKTKDKLVIILCSNDSEYVSSPINVTIDDMVYPPIDCTLEQYVSDSLADATPCLTTDNLGLFFMLCEYDFDFKIVG